MSDPTTHPAPPPDAPLGGPAQPPPRTHRGRYSCPCCWTTPCNPMCPCVQSFSSRPCERCCGSGSEDQRKRRAERLAAIIDAGNAAALRQPAPVAADGAGQGERRWMLRRPDGALGLCAARTPEEREALVAWTGGTPVRVLISVLADDAGADGAGETIVLGLVDHVNDLSASLAAAEAARAAAEGEATRLREALNNFVDNAGGYDKSVTRAAAIFLEQAGHKDLADRLRGLDDAGAAALAGPAGGAAGRDVKA